MDVTLWTGLGCVASLSEILLAVTTRTRQSGGKVQDRGSQFVLWIVILVSVTACEWIRRITPVSILGGAHWLRLLSLIVLAVGLAIRWTAIVTLGKSFSVNVAIRESQKLHSTGLYGFVRHPSYLGMLLIFLAIGLHSCNWVSLVIVLLPTTFALLYRIHVEEAVLREAFGEQYVVYSRDTKCLVPGVF